MTVVSVLGLCWQSSSLLSVAYLFPHPATENAAADNSEPATLDAGSAAVADPPPVRFSGDPEGDVEDSGFQNWQANDAEAEHVARRQQQVG